MLDLVLETLHQEKPHLTEAYIKSDNAGCYKSGPLIQHISKRNQGASLKVKRYDFSESQSGKDICDAKSACAKFHMLKFIDNGNNVETPEQMKAALDSAGGARGIKTAVVDIEQKKEPNTKKFKIKNVSQYYSFQFEGDSIRVWRAYQIGHGYELKLASNFPTLTPLKVF